MVHDKIAQLEEPLARAEGLTPLQMRALFAVQYRGALTIKELCHDTDMGQANASTFCKKLEQAGFLKRERDAEDERRVHLSLTGKGEAATEAFWHHMREYDARAGALSEERQRQILRGLAALNSTLTDMLEQIKSLEE